MHERLINWADAHRTSYIQSGGAQGHIMDMSFAGGYRYETMLLRYVGRKTGKTIINGLGYLQYGPEVVIVASKGGADDHPQWYLNLKAGGAAEIQIATQAFKTTRREPEASEKEEVWKWVIQSTRLFKTYREKSKRDIPLILFTPLQESRFSRRRAAENTIRRLGLGFRCGIDIGLAQALLWGLKQIGIRYGMREIEEDRGYGHRSGSQRSSGACTRKCCAGY